MIWITYLVSCVFFPILVTWFVAFLDAQKQSWSVTDHPLKVRSTNPEPTATEQLRH